MTDVGSKNPLRGMAESELFGTCGQTPLLIYKCNFSRLYVFGHTKK